jgi:hypothetical protein
LSAKFEIDGLDDLTKDFQKLAQRAKYLAGDSEVPFNTLFTQSFMAKHTPYESIDEFLDNSGLDISSNDDFDNIPQEKLDEYVKKVSDFNSWEEMFGAASDEYIFKKLGL